MLQLRELENELSANYPLELHAITRKKRQQNINALSNLVSTAGNEGKLHYGSREERITLYTTSEGELITIQYPGQETAPSNPRDVHPYDFRPRIITKDGNILKDLVFADMWNIVDSIDRGHHDMTKSLSALFFKMGRMLYHEKICADYSFETIDITSGEIIESGTRKLEWYALTIPDEVIETLNFFISPITIDDGTTISFEAFLYFFSLILENEDIKYNYIKNDLSSGRIPTSDTMLLIASYLCDNITISTLLQRFVSGFGVARCNNNEIEPATSGLIHITSLKQQTIDFLDTEKIPYKNGSTITISGISIRTQIKIDNPKVAIIKEPDNEKKKLLTSKGWTVFDFESAALNREYYSRMLFFIKGLDS